MSKRTRACLLLAACLAIAGCRMKPDVRAAIDAVNADRRWLENRVFDLEYDLQVAYDELDRLEGKRTSTDPNRSSLDRARSSSSDASDKPSSSGSDSSSKSKLDLPTIDPPPLGGGRKPSTTPKKPSLPDLSEPEIDLGTPDPKPKSSSSSSSSSMREIPFNPPLRAASLPEPPATVTRETAQITSAPRELVSPVSTDGDASITQLYLNPYLTAGTDIDGKPGDDGLIVVVEPRNAANEFVPQTGPISVVLIDPTKEGDAARVARWNFDAADAGRFLKGHSQGTGLRLQMTWPGPVPENSHLRLFVRYETADGRHLQADQDLYITLANQLSQNWNPKGKAASGTPRPSQRPPSRTSPAELDIEPPSNAPPLSVSTLEKAPAPRPAWSPQR